MIKLSVVMPCFNVAATLGRALDSILKQDVNFDYEIIIVNDASTDDTLAVAKVYQEKYGNIVILENDKNSGNAFSFYRGLCASKGDYFCVLDGDDYYTIKTKLQKQIDFLDADINDEYVGTCTNFIIDLGNDMVSIPDRSKIKEFTYTDFLTQRSGYYHTATYIYKNIFRGNVPEEFSRALYRGDTPRTMFHLKFSAKKIKVLDFVGSAYTFEFYGIWSSLTQKEQCEYQINYQTKHKDNVETAFEKRACDVQIAYYQNMKEQVQDILRRYPALSIDRAIEKLFAYANTMAFKEKDYVLNNFYCSEYLDTLFASLNCVFNTRHKGLIPEKINNDRITIMAEILFPHGGGIFSEINQLIEIYKEKQVFLFLTSPLAHRQADANNEGCRILSKHKNLTIVQCPFDGDGKLLWLLDKLREIAPERCYYYCSHANAYGAAMMQAGMKNEVLFSFDHGFVCGVLNPNVSLMVAKRPVDYWMLKKRLGDKVIFIPTWEKEAEGCEGYTYTPFKDHEALITASGAARFYKVDGAPPNRYIDMIVELLAKTGGKHYHFGPIPEEVIEELRGKMQNMGVKEEQFINIVWSDNLPLDLLRKHVDVFIEPFPVVSYKLTLIIESVGIPVFAKKGHKRLDTIDFIPEAAPLWKNRKSFITQLCNLDAKTLAEQSLLIKEYFYANHSIPVVQKRLFKDEGIAEVKKYEYTDNSIAEMMNFTSLFDDNYNIAITTIINNEENRARREHEAQEARTRQEWEVQEARRRQEQEARQAEEQRQRIEFEARQALEQQIMKIRNHSMFKLFFVALLPLRAVKCAVLDRKNEGLGNMITMERANKNEELKVVRDSLAYRLARVFDRSL